jgi:hypothetical protein
VIEKKVPLARLEQTTRGLSNTMPIRVGKTITPVDMGKT